MDETTKDAWSPTKHGGLRRESNAQVAQLVERHSDEVTVGSARVPGFIARLKRNSEKRGNGSAGPSPSRTEESHGTGFESPPALKLNRKFEVKLRERLGLPECPYVIRWRLETPWFSIRLHHWLASDDPRHRHDHPWSFTTFVLKGGYTDSSPDGDEHLRAGAIRYRPATHRHTVFPDGGGCWTVIVTGPITRYWGFWTKDGTKFVRNLRYFLKYGHHPCD